MRRLALATVLLVSFAVSLGLVLVPSACGPKLPPNNGAKVPDEYTAQPGPPPEFEDPELTAAPETGRPRPGPR